MPASRPTSAGAVRPPGRNPGQVGRPLALSAGGARRGADRSLIGQIAAMSRSAAAPNSSAASAQPIPTGTRSRRPQQRPAPRESQRACARRAASDHRRMALRRQPAAAAAFGEHDQPPGAASSSGSASRLSSRGNRLTITGAPASAEIARSACCALYARLEAGGAVGHAEVEPRSACRDAAASTTLPTSSRAATMRRPRSAPARPSAPRTAAPGRLHRRCWLDARAGLRHRPGRHRQDLSGGRHGGGPAQAGRGRPHHPVAPGGRGRRAARLPARRHEGEGRSLSAAALRRAARHDAGRDRWRAASSSGEIEIAPLAFMRGRTLAERLRHPGRGAEHHRRCR